MSASNQKVEIKLSCMHTAIFRRQTTPMIGDFIWCRHCQTYSRAITGRNTDFARVDVRIL